MSFAVPVKATLKAIATHLPDHILSNALLAEELGNWTADKIEQKTGISKRHIAASGETASDLGVAAVERLFATHDIDRSAIDFLIFCSQAPDYILPTTACLMQDRLGLRTSCGALDITLGCSGFVYGLSLATGLISSGAASNILLVTADTYSKYINPADRSVRTLFGDGAAATLITANAAGASSSIGHFVFGTDGRGGNDLIVKTGGARYPRTHASSIDIKDDSGNIRSGDNLFMNGGSIMNFTLREIPKMYSNLKSISGHDDLDFDYVIMHQANKFILDALRKKMKLDHDRVPYAFEEIGNTVSSTIPFAIAKLMESGQIRHGKRAALMGFGVGLSWAGCVLEF